MKSKMILNSSGIQRKEAFNFIQVFFKDSIFLCGFQSDYYIFMLNYCLLLLDFHLSLPLTFLKQRNLLFAYLPIIEIKQQETWMEKNELSSMTMVLSLVMVTIN